MMPYKIVFVLAFTMVSVSCQKVLDTEPTHQLDASQRFNTLDDYESALIGAYALFQQDDYYGELSNAFITLPDMLSDNFNESGESLGNYTTLTSWRYAEDETNIDATWQAAYRVISQANLVLRGLDRF